MLTRRENLLIRPWQERRYIQHRNKVETALPAIDVRPPAPRCHVTYKLKKLQKENERCARIEQDNFTLLQHLRHIMETNRVDNYWVDAPPNFLHRVGIYCNIGNKAPSSETSSESDIPPTRKGRCLGCNPHRIKNKMKIPEERIPWERPHKKFTRRSSSLEELCLKKSSDIFTIYSIGKSQTTSDITKKKSSGIPESLKDSTKTSSSRETISKESSRKKSSHSITISTVKSSPRFTSSPLNADTQSIILTRGALRLAINFPPNTTVTLRDGNTEHILQREFCECKGTAVAKK